MVCEVQVCAAQRACSAGGGHWHRQDHSVSDAHSHAGPETAHHQLQPTHRDLGLSWRLPARQVCLYTYCQILLLLSLVTISVSSTGKLLEYI